MAAPQGPPQGGYENTGDGGAPAAAGRKKRAYAGQAYEFGAGANAGLGGQQPGGGDVAGFNQQAHEAGYPQGGYQQSAAAPAQGEGLGQQQPPTVGGYQPPAPGYPVQDASVNNVAQQFSQMDMGQKAQVPGRPMALNQLYPVDLLTTPFNVAELDYPPPPAILPQNVSSQPERGCADNSRPASPPPPMPTALPSTSDQLSTRFPPPIRSSKNPGSRLRW